jgi:chemotaxis protein CheX
VNFTVNRASQTEVRLDPTWKNILECAALEVFETMAGARLTPHPTPVDEPRGEQTAMVGLAGALCGMTTVRCSSRTAQKFASLMLGGDEDPDPSTVRDAMGELCNMVAGNFKAKISTLADRCMLSVPTVITGGDYIMQTIEPNDGFQLALSYEGNPIWVSLVIHS